MHLPSGQRRTLCQILHKHSHYLQTTDRLKYWSLLKGLYDVKFCFWINCISPVLLSSQSHLCWCIHTAFYTLMYSYALPLNFKHFLISFPVKSQFHNWSVVKFLNWTRCGCSFSYELIYTMSVESFCSIQWREELTQEIIIGQDMLAGIVGGSFSHNFCLYVHITPHFHKMNHLRICVRFPLICPTTSF